MNYDLLVAICATLNKHFDGEYTCEEHLQKEMITCRLYFSETKGAGLGYLFYEQVYYRQEGGDLAQEKKLLYHEVYSYMVTLGVLSCRAAFDEIPMLKKENG